VIRQAGETVLTFQVEQGLGRIRLDEYLFARLGSLSRMYLRDLVKTDRVLVNGEFANTGVRLRANDFVEVTADMSRGTAMLPESISLNIVYEDRTILVVDKPPGMLVHPTHRDKHGTLLNALVHHLNREEKAVVARPGLVHRLDRETSGLIVVSKTVSVHRLLAREFMKKRVEKKYFGLVGGLVKDDGGTIGLPVGRHAEKKYWDVKDDGKVSTTRYRVLDRFRDTTLLDLEPVTGRTNQLRIHCAAIGHPIVGDVRRGGREYARLCLHAYSLSFRHPESREQMLFTTGMPDEFRTC
jgi:23S rRNA pseudouridine1911/1915/1917 synthase